MTVSKSTEIQIHERLTRIETQIESIDGKLNNLIENQMNTPSISSCQRIQKIYNKLHCVQLLILVGILIAIFTGSLYLPIPLRKIETPKPQQNTTNLEQKTELFLDSFDNYRS